MRRRIRKFFKSLELADSARVVFVTLQMLLEKILGKRVVVLDLEEATLAQFLSPVIEQLQHHTDRMAYFGVYKTICPPVGSLIIPKRRTLNYRLTRRLGMADMFISPHIFGKASPRTIKLHIPHGHQVKFASLPKEYFEGYDAHFLVGPLHREQAEFTIASYELTQDIKLYNVGLPKSDALMNGGFDRNSVLVELGLDPARKTVIYAPSWEEGLSLRSFGRDLFGQLASLENLNVIIRLHPTSLVTRDHPQFALYTGGIDWGQVVSEFMGHPGIRFIADGSTDRLLAASDIMVTDISGVALEFLALLKPVIYMDCPDFFSKTLTSLYRNYGSNTADNLRNDPKINAGRHVGYVIENLKELPNAVEYLLAHPTFKERERNEFAGRLRYNPGHSSQVAARIILEMLHLENKID